MSTSAELGGVPLGPAKPRRTKKAAPRPWLQPALVVGAGVPAVFFAVQALRGKLGANPIAETLNALGLTGLILLVLSLACTPVRLITGVAWIQPLRRTFGLLGALYVALHVLVYVALDQGLALSAIVADVIKRPFISVGMLAFLLLIPLSITSTKAQIARLGGAKWRKLHKLAYLVAPLGVIHFFLRVKKDITEPLIYGGIVLALLGVRVVVALRKRANKPFEEA